LWNFHKKCEIPQNLKTQCYKQISEVDSLNNEVHSLLFIHYYE
jgi:hypothetical protein